MPYIPVLLGSTRRDRQSPRAADFVLDRLRSRDGVTSELLDLLELDIPMMEERLQHLEDPSPGLVALARAIGRADGLVIVAPEYNHGYPGVLKNALDHLRAEYSRKPVGIVSVSAGGLGGIRCLEQLRLVVLGLGAVPIPAALSISRIQAAFDERGRPTDAGMERRVDTFLDELTWYAEALRAGRRRDAPDAPG